LQRYAPENSYFLFTPGIRDPFRSFADGHDRTQLVVPKGIWKAMPAAWRSVSAGRECRDLNLDIYHGLSNELPFNISSFSGLKVVTIHDLIFLRFPSYYHPIDRKLYTLKTRHACRVADLVVAPSAQTASDIATFTGTPLHKIVVIGQNCDERFGLEYSDSVVREFAVQKKLPQQFILSVGTPEKRKDQLTILQALLSPGLEQIHLVLAGKHTSYAQELTHYAAAHGLTQRFHLLTDISNEEMPLLYRNATAFVYASGFEGFGIPLLEAMRSSVPVISAYSSSLTEVAGEAALYFKPQALAELAEHLRVLLSNEPERNRLIEAGKKQSALFDTAALIGALHHEYRSRA
jgi:glycosyltransferase involved in cell wall biosynthesis